MGRRDKHLQQHVFGVVEIQVHGVFSPTLVTLDKQLMDLSIASKPRRLKT
jgi:hypothetical protein